MPLDVWLALMRLRHCVESQKEETFHHLWSDKPASKACLQGALKEVPGIMSTCVHPWCFVYPNLQHFISTILELASGWQLQLLCFMTFKLRIAWESNNFIPTDLCWRKRWAEWELHAHDLSQNVLEDKVMECCYQRNNLRLFSDPQYTCIQELLVFFIIGEGVLHDGGLCNAWIGCSVLASTNQLSTISQCTAAYISSSRAKICFVSPEHSKAD